MQIGLIHDYARGECPGGADATLQRLCDTAPKQVELLWLPTDPLQWNYFEHFIVASTRSINNVHLEYLLEEKKYVKLHLDYHYTSPKIIRDATLLVYMSPKQKLDMLGSLQQNFHIMPSLVDPDLFYPADKPGEGYLWVGGYSRQKGIRNLWEWAHENKVHIDLYGHGTPRVYLEQSEYCHIKKAVPYERVPEILRQYQTLIHLPKGPEAGSRVFIESILSGLSVVTNKFEGDISFDRPYSKRHWKQRLQCAPAQFWKQAIKKLQR